LKVRGIIVPAKMHAVVLRSIVEKYFQDPSGPPAELPITTPTVDDIRYLILLLFRVFSTLFSTELKGEAAGNCFDELVIQFLVCVAKVGSACHPNKKEPIWQSKYGLLGLLRCRQHFIDYTYPHSLYEGGIEGEGMVKELRPLCPNAVRSGWPVNLMNAYNRQNSLSTLTAGFQSLTHIDAPTAWQHNANGKRYASWADVEHGINCHTALSMVVLGDGSCFECHILVHMFRVTYCRRVLVGSTTPMIDYSGFVFHEITLDNDVTKVYDAFVPVRSFGMLLPAKDKAGKERYCLLDKDWRFVGVAKKWTLM
jgi:hypothetical protein